MPSTTKKNKAPRRWLWFVGLYLISLLVFGFFMAVLHILIDGLRHI